MSRITRSQAAASARTNHDGSPRLLPATTKSHRAQRPNSTSKKTSSASNDGDERLNTPSDAESISSEAADSQSPQPTQPPNTSRYRLRSATPSSSTAPAATINNKNQDTKATAKKATGTKALKKVSNTKKTGPAKKTTKSIAGQKHAEKRRASSTSHDSALSDSEEAVNQSTPNQHQPNLRLRKPAPPTQPLSLADTPIQSTERDAPHAYSQTTPSRKRPLRKSTIQDDGYCSDDDVERTAKRARTNQQPTASADRSNKSSARRRLPRQNPAPQFTSSSMGIFGSARGSRFFNIAQGVDEVEVEDESEAEVENVANERPAQSESESQEDMFMKETSLGHDEDSSDFEVHEQNSNQTNSKALITMPSVERQAGSRRTISAFSHLPLSEDPAERLKEAHERFPATRRINPLFNSDIPEEYADQEYEDSIHEDDVEPMSQEAMTKITNSIHMVKKDYGYLRAMSKAVGLHQVAASLPESSKPKSSASSPFQAGKRVTSQKEGTKSQRKHDVSWKDSTSSSRQSTLLLPKTSDALVIPGNQRGAGEIISTDIELIELARALVQQKHNGGSNYRLPSPATLTNMLDSYNDDELAAMSHNSGSAQQHINPRDYDMSIGHRIGDIETPAGDPEVVTVENGTPRRKSEVQKGAIPKTPQHLSTPSDAPQSQGWLSAIATGFTGVFTSPLKLPMKLFGANQQAAGATNAHDESDFTYTHPTDLAIPTTPTQLFPKKRGHSTMDFSKNRSSKTERLVQSERRRPVKDVKVPQSQHRSSTSSRNIDVKDIHGDERRRKRVTQIAETEKVDDVENILGDVQIGTKRDRNKLRMITAMGYTNQQGTFMVPDDSDDSDDSNDEGDEVQSESLNYKVSGKAPMFYYLDNPFALPNLDRTETEDEWHSRQQHQRELMAIEIIGEDAHRIWDSRRRLQAEKALNHELKWKLLHVHNERDFNDTYQANLRRVRQAFSMKEGQQFRANEKCMAFGRLDSIGNLVDDEAPRPYPHGVFQMMVKSHGRYAPPAPKLRPNFNILGQPRAMETSPKNPIFAEACKFSKQVESPSLGESSVAYKSPKSSGSVGDSPMREAAREVALPKSTKAQRLPEIDDHQHQKRTKSKKKTNKRSAPQQPVIEDVIEEVDEDESLQARHYNGNLFQKPATPETDRIPGQVAHTSSSQNVFASQQTLEKTAEVIEVATSRDFQQIEGVTSEAKMNDNSPILQEKQTQTKPPPQPRPAHAELPQQKYAPKRPSGLRNVTAMSPSQKSNDENGGLFSSDVLGAVLGLNSPKVVVGEDEVTEGWMDVMDTVMSV